MSEARATAARHPHVLRLYDYWRAISPAGRLPGRQHVDPIDLRELLPYVWLLDVAPAPLRFRYRLIGTAVADRMGRDLTGRWLHEAHPGFQPGDPEHGAYGAVVATGQPDWRRGRPRFALNKGFPEIERIVLPMATDGSTVDMILGLTVFYAGPEDDAALSPPWPAIASHG